MAHGTESKPSKFAFVGPASVGKSTMTDIYKRRFDQCPYVVILEEGAQVLFQENPSISSGPIHILDIQERIQEFVLKREVAAYRPGVRLIISDRSVADPIVYAQFYLDPSSVQKLLHNAEEWLPTYTAFFLLNPTGVPYDEGPFRRESFGERLAIFDAFGEFFIRCNLPYKIISGSIPERVDGVDTVIYQHVSIDTFFQKDNSNNSAVGSLI